MKRWLVLILLLSLTSVAFGQEGPSNAEHHQVVARVLLSLILILLGAKLGGEIFERLRQPAVLGELIVGMLLGNLSLLGFHGLDFLKNEEILAILAELGVILLLFEVGLESDIAEMKAVGLSAFSVAVVGVITPFLLGWGVSSWLLPGAHRLVHVYVGAVLCATSVGITARVLRDLGKLATSEARIILGAAVIDDVLGLLVLAIVSGMIRAANRGATELPIGSLLWIVAKSVGFLFGAIWIGQRLSPRLFHLASKLRVHGMLLVTSLSFCFLMAYVASAIGLATIVGAFAAGLLLDRVHYRDFLDRGEHGLEEALRPLTTVFVPVFFVLMGIRVDLSSFGRTDILGFAALVTLAAILGKQACGLAVWERGVNRLAIGLGMIPRGEVGLIVASIGMTLTVQGERIVTPPIFSAIVIMVMVTTLLTPPLLKWAITRADALTTAIESAPSESSARS
ncbi:MAG: cation:proton antiporter [Blastocatellia bacterium]|nr:cation:proton antiporter [Blastocatellia bacterium]MCS7158381.1 cation:proton antiporter [Blastocatellia bacterium]MCX7752887.1 cation:proton antiporter [Blastocatellia bacterium]MDW8167943.1 cation:proton antiporter [Acidobacteriota bacterium]MDW8255968.1 cation:proton antiporter [Acidobacteriota bacterium]